MNSIPELADISISIGWYSELSHLPPNEFAAVMWLVGYFGISQVWTYSPPSPNGIPVKTAERICYRAGIRWSKVKSTVLEYFDLRDGYLTLKRDWVAIGDRGWRRPIIPASVRSQVVRRDGFLCCYCGSTDGPFDLDHIIPISDGGHPTDLENLIMACASCNRAKGARSLQSEKRE